MVICHSYVSHYQRVHGSEISKSLHNTVIITDQLSPGLLMGFQAATIHALHFQVVALLGKSSAINCDDINDFPITKHINHIKNDHLW